MIKINDRKISNEMPPYIIAELSANHCGDINNAFKSIKAAKESGADAIKLQTYKAESMTIDCNKDDFLIKNGLWNGYKLFDLYNEASTPYEWHKELFKYATDIGITIFSSPFDEEAIDLLESLNTPAYKIASFEIIDLPLIKYAASKGKPLLISTGMASEIEIEEAVKVAIDNGTGEILLFPCVSCYPAPTYASNLNMIKTLKDKFHLEIGLSDHTTNNTASLAAVSLGATAIEKHFIINKSLKGPDSAFSIDPVDLSNLKKDTEQCWMALGYGDFNRTEGEIKNKVFRRSLYFIKDMKRGETITEHHIKRIRPGFGIPPKFFDQIINMKVKKDIKKGDRVNWDIIE